jgi:hypothetical protein
MAQERGRRHNRCSRMKSRTMLARTSFIFNALIVIGAVAVAALAVA